MSLPSLLACNFKCFPLSLVERPKPLNYLKWFCTIPSVPSSLIILCASPSHRAFFRVFILAIHPTTGSLHVLLLLPGMCLPLYPLKHFFSVLSDLPNLARALSVYPPSLTFTTDVILNSTIRWFSSVQSLSRVWLFVTPWMAARQASLSITNSLSSLTLMSIKSVMPSSYLILYHSLLLLPLTPPSIRVFSNESTLRMRCPKY